MANPVPDGSGWLVGLRDPSRCVRWFAAALDNEQSIQAAKRLSPEADLITCLKMSASTINELSLKTGEVRRYI